MNPEHHEAQLVRAHALARASGSTECRQTVDLMSSNEADDATTCATYIGANPIKST